MPVEDFDRQDIRLAVVMNGGVSLAVWISGVTLELHRLAMARRTQDAVYDPLLDLLHADARVDVIAGTSAGGINGAFLALGLARGADIGGMRDLWRDKGAIDKLLRDPLEKNPPSLLMGDDYFLREVREALNGIKAGEGKGGGDPVELILTGTLWKGRETSFSDDLGVRITEVDHDARFRFGAHGSDGESASDSGGTFRDLMAEGVVDELAAAARCTSSFPAAFEPHWVEVSDAGGDGAWPSRAGTVNFRESQYVVDGGLLLNKPIRPALEAVYRQSAQLQVRRMLTYVVPDPGERAAAAQPSAGAAANGARGELPTAPEVLLGVLTRLRSTDSVSRELEEIRRRNEDVRGRRRARDRFAAALSDTAGGLARSAWDAYVDVRVESAAKTIGGLIAAGQQGAGAGRWSEREVVGQVRVLLREATREGGAESFIPTGSLDEAEGRSGAEWDWGHTTVQRLRDMAVDVLKRAVWLAPMGSDERRTIVEARGKISGIFSEIRTDWLSLQKHWSAKSAGGTAPLPPRVGDGLGRATNTAELRGWLAGALADGSAAERRPRQYAQATALAGCLRDCAAAIEETALRGNSVIDPSGADRARLKALYDCLLGPEDSAPTLRRMLRLEVVQLAYSGTGHEVEQEVELVQFSSRSPALLTGRQLHHFGAFWRPSWRVNDWIHGRMDGATHIVRMLLSPERLRQLGSVTEASEKPARVEELVKRIRDCVVSAGDDNDRAWLEGYWTREVEADCRGYLADCIVTVVADAESGSAQAPADPADDSAADDPRLRQCVQAITASLHMRILREDLDALAAAVSGEEDPTAPSRGWLSEFRAAQAQNASLPPQDLERLWQKAAAIGSQQIKDEIGGDHFARTVAQAAAVTANNAGALTRTNSSLKKIKPIGTVLDAFRGYALAVWAMVSFLTRDSRFGENTVQLAVAVGGALLGVAIIVPGVPLVFPLLGAMLLIAGWSAAALLTERTRPVGRQLLGLAALALLVLGGYAAWEWHRDGFGSAVGVAVKAAVVVLIVLLGWWIARARRPVNTVK